LRFQRFSAAAAAAAAAAVVRLDACVSSFNLVPRDDASQLTSLYIHANDKHISTTAIESGT